MAVYTIQDTTLTAIADAINAKTGGSSAMSPAQMATAIANIPSGGGSDLSAVDVLVGDYLSATDLVVTTGAVDRYKRFIVGN